MVKWKEDKVIIRKNKKMEQYLKIRLLWAMHKETHELV